MLPSSSPNAPNSARNAGREQQAERRCRGSTRRGRSTSDLGQHGAQHLAARGAERAQQRELARALGDRDRERVEDQEAADQQRDAGEHEQRGADEAERVGRGPAPASRPAPCRCGRRSPWCRARVTIAALSCLRRRAACGGDGDVVVAVVAGHPLRLGQRQDDQPRAGEVVGVAERGDAGDRVLLGRGLARDRDGVALVEVVLVGRRLVERDLVVAAAAGRPPCSRTGRSASGGAVMASVGGPLERIGSPLRSSSVTSSETEPNASSTPSHRLARAASVSVRHRRRLREVLLDGEARLHRDVGALLGALEQVLERGVDRVREDERAGHERDAEDDGEAGEGGAQLAGREALQRDLEQLRHRLHQVEDALRASRRRRRGRSGRR